MRLGQIRWIQAVAATDKCRGQMGHATSLDQNTHKPASPTGECECWDWKRTRLGRTETAVVLHVSWVWGRARLDQATNILWNM